MCAYVRIFYTYNSYINAHQIVFTQFTYKESCLAYLRFMTTFSSGLQIALNICTLASTTYQYNNALCVCRNQFPGNFNEVYKQIINKNSLYQTLKFKLKIHITITIAYIIIFNRRLTNQPVFCNDEGIDHTDRCMFIVCMHMHVAVISSFCSVLILAYLLLLL